MWTTWFRKNDFLATPMSISHARSSHMAGKGTSIYSYLLIDMMFGRFVLLRVEIKSHKILSTKTAKKRLAKCSPGTRHCEPLFRPALVGKNPTCHKNLAQIKMSLIQPFPMQQLTKMSRHRDWDIACKVYIGNLGNNASKYEIEDAFGKYGPLRNVWVARNPPGFAFVEFEDPRDAEDSVRGLDGTRVCGVSISF